MARDVARTRDDLALRVREDGTLELRANGLFVMDTAETSTERALATAALAQAGPGPLTVLVGGLGLGFTAAAVLDDDRVERCVVAELEPRLVAWLRDGTVPHGPALLDDPRLEVVVGDVADLLSPGTGPSYDLVLLDVDNGPDNLVHNANAALYAVDGLRKVRQVLRPGGRLVVWSADRSSALAAAVTAVLGRCEEIELPVRLQGRDEAYWLYEGAVASQP
ncbi:hypothetical protein GCM10011519_30160 [Marmoricola endophyticus]|uniref:Spermidine synthase n=1 Tax=Marmoricola endophyticus TaxID=2040280 RepID=A0A917BPI9_9ACTN|nr:hypothetical protein [Marmoricola endophyticus]GGF54218.1 hypothetical protein GCM10011519_30160 [Marmoricola endophyticus]